MRRKQAKSKKVTEAEALQHLERLSEKLVDLPQNSSKVQELRGAIERARKVRQFGYFELQYLDQAMKELKSKFQNQVE
ncbi:XRE family transcriptional regulator [Streptococcus intermedius]|uniref:XRE family transcriptional regulator n=1 Tax=Streptococcus intermedius TaxID=1338 RepID=UPI000DD7A2B7|nr:XRE family transcriptional regulator [Streptococcus intermedius]